ncbi:MAG: hypothetical protein EOP53_05600 [Sphingobacteriales bacterium]|nr:MAG: hypothetical protein EOP53_05600 [Sphingobacteriales bacterium]
MKKFTFICAYLSIFLFNTGVLKAQVGSVIAPNQFTIGVETAWQKDYATGIGITTHFSLSIIDALVKDRNKNGFKIRDVNGGHISLGGLMHPKNPTLFGNSTTVKGPVWYSVGLDYFGLQALYKFSDGIYLSIKGQLLWNLNNASYFEKSSGFASKVITAGTQVGPVGLELGKGWSYGKNGTNYFTSAISIKNGNKQVFDHILGLRYTRHERLSASSYMVNGVYERPVQKNYYISAFYGFCF